MLLTKGDSLKKIIFLHNFYYIFLGMYFFRLYKLLYTAI